MYKSFEQTVIIVICDKVTVELLRNYHHNQTA